MSANATTIPPDTKTHLLEVGYQLIAKKGFTAVGIKQILDTAGLFLSLLCVKRSLWRSHYHALL